MDGSEHNHRPYKRIRLEDTFESRNTSINSVPHDEPSQGRDDSFYTQTPPSSNLEVARSIHPFVSTCETETHHRLIVEYQSARCAELNHQGVHTSGSITSCSPSGLYSPAETPLEYKSELTTKKCPDQVCFGMVGPHPVVQYSRNVLIML